MTRPANWSDLVTDAIEAVMRERAIASGENPDSPGWKMAAFESAFADRSVLLEATRRALEFSSTVEEPDQKELFEVA